MRRDLEKSIEAYKKKFYNATGNAGAFFASDLHQIKELSTDSGGGGATLGRYRLRIRSRLYGRLSLR